MYTLCSHFRTYPHYLSFKFSHHWHSLSPFPYNIIPEIYMNFTKYRIRPHHSCTHKQYNKRSEKTPVFYKDNIMKKQNIFQSTTDPSVPPR